MESLRNYYKHNKFIIMVYISLLIAFIWGLYQAIFEGNLQVIFTLCEIFILLLVPIVIQDKFKILLPKSFVIAIVAFIYGSLFCGELLRFYLKFEWWDVMLHTFSAFAFAFLAFTFLYMLYRAKKLDTHPIIIGIFAFSFSMMIAGMWEVFEYTLDVVIKSFAQKPTIEDMNVLIQSVNALPNPFPEGKNIFNIYEYSPDLRDILKGMGGLTDTMGDIIVSVIGALFVSISGVLYIYGTGGHKLGQISEDFFKDNKKLVSKKSKFAFWRK